MGAYKLYGYIKTIEYEITNTNDDRYITNQVLFDHFVMAYNEIAMLVRYNRRLPYFNLKQNWALIKSQDFGTALTNLKNWVMKVDDRYDGENWNEYDLTQ